MCIQNNDKMVSLSMEFVEPKFISGVSVGSQMDLLVHPPKLSKVSHGKHCKGFVYVNCRYTAHLLESASKCMFRTSHTNVWFTVDHTRLTSLLLFFLWH